jgi:hypothetical protein
MGTKTPEKSTRVKPRTPKRGILESTPTSKKWTVLESGAKGTHLPSGFKQRNESPFGSCDECYKLELSGHITVIVAV